MRLHSLSYDSLVHQFIAGLTWAIRAYCIGCEAWAKWSAQ
jgi:hypothetical protein